MSSAIQWSNDFESGVQALDQHHQTILSLLQRIDAAISRLDGEQAEHLVIELLDFTVTHNHLEDEIMARTGYPHAKEHQAAHDQFLGSVDDYMQQIVAGENPFVLARRVRQEMTCWVESHLMQDDLRCVRYINTQCQQQGIEARDRLILAR